MIEVKRGLPEHVEGISKVCIEGRWAAIGHIKSPENLRRNDHAFYNEDRIRRELDEAEGWDGYFVALDNGKVVGAIGGGMTGEQTSEVFVFYLDPSRRREGIGTKLLNHLTEVQRQKGAKEQWVSVLKGNNKGIPFYEAMGFRFVCEREAYGNVDGEDYLSLRYRRDI
ncbi:GNAT family N-acetyltransferase [Sediminibacillus dalangtanensis]|uniref:GNAT family N-acetyltransferase n=1 Tax=Sediminibacillus dalangtanensis TaxID=2729421 RepID=A0ABX7VTZ4_9BACI|nr:GNAT family N-acetyltransferase [Sediminibacillus dalangtanensis]QTN00350.1 GNAT family N-acetyltransferase [Sediminibacillus dalangtanensis]